MKKLILQKSKHLSMIFSVLVLLLFSSPIHAGVWIRDSKCKVWSSDPQYVNITYSGDCVDGIAHGEGSVTWWNRDGEKVGFFEGQFNEGKPQEWSPIPFAMLGVALWMLYGLSRGRNEPSSFYEFKPDVDHRCISCGATLVGDEIGLCRMCKLLDREKREREANERAMAKANKIDSARRAYEAGEISDYCEDCGTVNPPRCVSHGACMICDPGDSTECGACIG